MIVPLLIQISIICSCLTPDLPLWRGHSRRNFAGECAGLHLYVVVQFNNDSVAGYVERNSSLRKSISILVEDSGTDRIKAVLEGEKGLPLHLQGKERIHEPIEVASPGENQVPEGVPIHGRHRSMMAAKHSGASIP